MEKIANFEALRLWVRTGEISDVKILGMLRKKLGDQYIDDLLNEFDAWPSNPKEIWIFTTVSQVRNNNHNSAVWLKISAKLQIIARLMAGEKAVAMFNSWKYQYCVFVYKIGEYEDNSPTHCHKWMNVPEGADWGIVLGDFCLYCGKRRTDEKN